MRVCMEGCAAHLPSIVPYLEKLYELQCVQTKMVSKTVQQSRPKNWVFRRSMTCACANRQRGIWGTYQKSGKGTVLSFSTQPMVLIWPVPKMSEQMHYGITIIFLQVVYCDTCNDPYHMECAEVQHQTGKYFDTDDINFHCANCMELFGGVWFLILYFG